MTLFLPIILISIGIVIGFILSNKIQNTHLDIRMRRERNRQKLLCRRHLEDCFADNDRISTGDKEDLLKEIFNSDEDLKMN